jgi:hypothetical protein
MPRILKPGPRPYVAVAIVLGVVAILAMCPVFRSGKPWQAIQVGAGMLVLYGAVCLAISCQRVVVDGDSVAFQELFKRTNRVHFSDISKSVARLVAEPEHPIALDIYTHDGKRPTLRLRLKPFRQADVAWLVEVPELKVRRSEHGLTIALHSTPGWRFGFSSGIIGGAPLMRTVGHHVVDYDFTTMHSNAGNLLLLFGIHGSDGDIRFWMFQHETLICKPHQIYVIRHSSSSGLL